MNHQLITYQELGVTAQNSPHKVQINLKPEDKNMRPTQWEDVYAMLKKYDAIPEPLKNCSELCIITRARCIKGDESATLYITLYGQ